MSQGFSVESFGGVVSVSKKTVYNWMDAHPEFLHAVQKGQQKCRLFWEAVGVRGTVGKINGFRERSWTVNMVNRFAWKQRVEHSGEIEHKGLSGGKLGKIMKNPKAAEKVLELAEMLAEDDDEE